MPKKILLDSFNRINDLGNKFWQRFYVHFLASDERVGKLFEGTDMMQQVTMMSKSTIHVVLNSSSFTPLNSKLMTTLIHKHNVELAIPKELYAKWGESFLLALEELDPEFDEVLKGSWKIAIDHFLEAFIGSDEEQTPMKRVIYVSNRPETTTEDEITNILEVSRRNNALKGIAGVLVTLPENFFQLIEGPPEAIAELMEKIQLDNRHKGVFVLKTKQVNKYEMTHWSMKHHAVENELADSFTVLNNFAKYPAVNDQSISGVEMVLTNMGKN